MKSLAVVAAAVLSLGGVMLAPAALADAVPFTDTDQNGFIAFCDKSGHQITSGDVKAAPFVWTALASTPVPPEYAGSNRKAVLTAFQPRREVDPGQWSGGQLTASTAYTNPEHPVAQATDTDGSLLSFIQAYPAGWDGLVEVRMYFSAPNLPPHGAPYPATVIRVTGTRWQVVSGGSLSCDSGRGTSVEKLYLPAAKTTVAQGVTPAPTAAATGAALVKASAKSSGFLGSPTGFGLAGVVALLVGGLVVAIRRGRPVSSRRH